MTEQKALLVTGASGQLGRRVVQHLRELYDGPIVVATRSPAKIANLAAQGISVREADFDDPITLERAFESTARVLMISTDAHGIPGKRLQQHQNAILAAKRAGVGHVLYTSLTRCEPGSPMKIASDHWGTEQALIASGLGYTILRNNLYAEIVLEFLPKALSIGKIVAAASDGSVAWIPRDDVALAAASALHRPPEGNVVLDITGSAPVSYAELAAMAAAVSGRPLRYEAVSPEDLRQAMSGAGLPEHVVDVLISFQLAAGKGDLAVCTDAVAQLMGRGPMSMRTFLDEHSAKLREAVA